MMISMKMMMMSMILTISDNFLSCYKADPVAMIVEKEEEPISPAPEDEEVKLTTMLINDHHHH